MPNNILVLGGCGYVGTPLVEFLLSKGHKITVVDTQWFGNYFENKTTNLKVFKDDIRDIKEIYFKEIDCLIHLANICNDPSVDLNPTLSWEVNVLSMKKICDLSINNNLKKIIFASSGSVYGLSDKDQVTEEVDLKPISVYNKTKMIAERVLMSYSDKIKTYAIRPATVCGWSPRMRLDVAVNMLTYQALSKSKITVHGGSQIRPNIHISDLISVYDFFIDNDNINNGFFNAGFENISILDLAKKIKNKINCEINVSTSNDPRSYRQDSSKLLSLGFKKKYSVDDAIDQLIEKHKKGELYEGDCSYTVKRMKELDIS